MKIYAPQENFGDVWCSFAGQPSTGATDHFQRDNAVTSTESHRETLRLGVRRGPKEFHVDHQDDGGWRGEILSHLAKQHLGCRLGGQGKFRWQSTRPTVLSLIVGCSHPTIEKIVEAAKNGQSTSHYILSSVAPTCCRRKTTRSLALPLRCVTPGARCALYRLPVHCTGEPAFAILKETFRDYYVYAGLGTTVLLGPKVTVRAEAGQPNKYAMDEEDLRTYREAMVHGPLRALLGNDGRLARARR